MGKIGKTFGLFLILLISMSCLTLLTVKPANAQTRTLVVPDQYTTIQDAINNANAGDTVYVKAGNYALTGSVTGLTIDKPISLIGENKDDTILSQVPYKYNYNAIAISADNVTVSGFTIKEGITDISVGGSGCKITNNNIVNSYYVGVSAGGSNNVISGNNISGNPSFGIYMTSSDSIISHNNISNNTSGIIIDSCKNVTIAQNSIMENGDKSHMDGNGGLILRWNGPFYVEENNITDNYGFGIQFGEICNNSTVWKNNIVANYHGVALLNYVINPSGSVFLGTGNQVYGNNVVNNTKNAYVEQAYSYPLNKLAGDIGNGTDVVLWDADKVGNYWSDYNGKGNYVIDQNNVDNYPLIQQANSNSTPTVPELSWLAIVPLLFSVFAIAVALRRRKTILVKKF